MVKFWFLRKKYPTKGIWLNWANIRAIRRGIIKSWNIKEKGINTENRLRSDQTCFRQLKDTVVEYKYTFLIFQRMFCRWPVRFDSFVRTFQGQERSTYRFQGTLTSRSSCPDLLRFVWNSWNLTLFFERKKIKK